MTNTETSETPESAFDPAARMEDTILDVERAAAVLSLLACSKDVETDVSDACYLLERVLRTAIADLNDQQGKLFRFLRSQAEAA